MLAKIKPICYNMNYQHKTKNESEILKKENEKQNFKTMLETEILKLKMKGEK